ncbi:hypothetical protein [Streptomyces collinus]|uniref:hypothetical protein n=1 Tax=Streptomyces collinus TaxID=42684 RepID=UPI00369EB40B
MGIRTLHRLTAEGPPARVHSTSAPAAPVSPVPALAAGASTARIPADPAATLRRAVADLRRRPAAGTRLAPVWRARADLARAYLALLLTLVPRARPRRTLTVFVATLSEPPTGPGGRRPAHRDRPGAGPDATT